MEIDSKLLEILRCPSTGQRVRHASPAELAEFDSTLEAGLLIEDGTTLYPVRDGIPIMLQAEALRKN